MLPFDVAKSTILTVRVRRFSGYRCLQGPETEQIATVVFPDSPRVIYEKNTLATVICQLRFPPVLRVDSDAPADFQDRIRDAYPLFNEKRSPELPAELPPEIARLLASELPISGSAHYEFASADENWTVTLTKEFLALTAKRYERWEDFKEHLCAPRESLNEIYRPAFCSRIGLRYRNVIRRSALDLGDIDWSLLLEKPILGELSVPEFAPRIKNSQRELVVELEDEGQVRIKHGLKKNPETDETFYVIDADYFTEKRTEVNDAIDTLDRFNRESGRLFRWCITERLHDAMGPQPVG